MAEAGMFIGWGAPVRGREATGLKVFEESLQYWGSLQADARIESFEVVLLGPHGGDLAGFSLLRGSEDQLDAVRRDEAFQRLLARANLIIERLGVVPAVLGEGLAAQIGLFQEQVADLT